MEDLEYAEGVELAHQLQHEGARNVLVSLGADGAFLLTEDQRLFSANAVPGTVRNTVGAGDALIAGFLTGFHESSDFAEALRLGIAAGCATAFDEWLGSRESTYAVREYIRVEEVTV